MLFDQMEWNTVNKKPLLLKSNIEYFRLMQMTIRKKD